ncbi:TonB-dependent receptor [Phenylobacterium sp.]|uniref:TonB-dependent receptor n=1 Tax=Phenylobacterium sp. TaxID=1871053 RepID=UPI003561AD2F
MQLKLNRALCATTALASGLLLATSAFAQSTATQVQEVIVTGARGAPTTAGLAQQVQVAKDESVVTQDFIKNQVGSSNFAQLINLLPGVSYSSEDSTGILSGDFRMHGLDCNHLSVTIDGSPVNDTGNYACFPGEYLVGELTDHIKVDIGATDIDSPTASAVGGQVNIISKTPPDTFGVIGSISGGSYSYRRLYAEIDTGAIGPWGTRAYAAINGADVDKYKGGGDINRKGFDARIYQPLKGSDFISLAGSWVRNRPFFYFSASRAQLAQFGNDFDYNTMWAVPTIRPGVADGVATPLSGAAAVAAGLPASSGQAGSDTNYWALHPNPVDFATIRGSSKFTLTDNLILTVDPSFFYTMANGGGSTGISECDKRLLGRNFGTSATVPTAFCRDLNGDGDTLDTVALYTPNNTNTHRWVLTSSLLWDINATNHIQLAYTYDYGHHRQSGEYTTVNPQTGDPMDPIGGKDGYGKPILTSDGSILRGRDRLSFAKLNQVAVNYIGSFMDDKIKVNIGVRDPHFERDLNQYCYGFNGTTVFCSTVDPTLVSNALALATATKNTNATSATVPVSLNTLVQSTVTINALSQTPNFRMPFSQTFRYDKVLPNAGITYRPADAHQFYASYAEGFSAPKTDDLYTSSPENVQPETTKTYSAGYRYQTHILTASANLYDTQYKNRIVQSIDPNDPTLSIDRNVGDVDVYGFDGEVGIKPVEHLSLYASATIQKSEIKSNIAISVGGQPGFLPTKGKQFVMTPEREFSGRAQYDWNDFTFGLTAKYISSRFISDINDDRIPGYGKFDLDVNYKLPEMFGMNTSVRVNVDNLFDRNYISRSSTVNTTKATQVTLVNGSTATFSPGTPFLSVGSPRTVYVTLRGEF